MGVSAGGGERVEPRTRGNGPYKRGEPSGLACECECAKDVCEVRIDAVANIWIFFVAVGIFRAQK